MMGRRQWGTALALAAFAVPLWLSLPGCISAGPDLSAYVRDGVQYGVTPGRFRGRWWNYYERGRSFAEGGYWAEAERDFRMALARRSTDARWVRTYGLHFMPEYFPNRELGVALYHQGRVEEAVGHLQTSLEHQPSARAAFQLTRALREHVQRTGIDTALPTWEWVAPAVDAVGQRTVLVRGTARDDQAIASVAINGMPVPVHYPGTAVDIEYSLEFPSGQTAIRVEIEDVAGQRAAFERPIEVDTDGPAVAFERPVIVPGLVRGRVYDPAGVSAVTIGGVSAQLAAADPDGSQVFSVDVPPLEQAMPMFRAEDSLGNATAGTVPVQAALVPEAMLGAGMAVRAREGGVDWRVLGTPDGAAPPGERRIWLAQAAPMPVAGVRIENPREGDVYQQAEIVVDVVWTAGPSAVAVVSSAGSSQAVRLMPTGEPQRISCRVPLELGENVIRAELTDASDRRVVDEIRVIREPGAREVGRLQTAFIGMGLLRYSPDYDNYLWVAEAAQGNLLAAFNNDTRFGVAVRNIEDVQQIVFEQGLGLQALYTGEAKSVGREDLEQLRAEVPALEPAEVLLSGFAEFDADTLTLRLDAMPTERYAADIRATLATVDVCRAFDVSATDRDTVLREAAQMLFVRLKQEFPLVEGFVWEFAGGSAIATTLNPVDHRVRENTKIVVLERQTSTRRGVTITEEQIVGEGIIVGLGEQLSQAELLTMDARLPEIATDEHVVVVTK